MKYIIMPEKEKKRKRGKILSEREIKEEKERGTTKQYTKREEERERVLVRHCFYGPRSLNITFHLR